MDMSKFEHIKNIIFQANRLLISTSDIKYIEWLTKEAPKKATSSVIIEFTKAEDANKTIDEGLV
jgi:hypothetical protein